MFKPDDYRAQLHKEIGFNTMTHNGELIEEVTIGTKTQTVSLKDFQSTNYGKIDEDIVFGSIVHFNSIT